MEEKQYAVGTVKGCYTIIGGNEEYRQFKINEAVERAKRLRISCETEIEAYKNAQGYVLRCECGKEDGIDSFEIEGLMKMEKGPRYCRTSCGKREAQRLEKERKRIANYQRVEAECYNPDLTGTYHGTLEIVECTDERVEGDPGGGMIVPIYRKYKCRCHLCNTEYEFISPDFNVGWVQEERTKRRYTSNAQCKCDKGGNALAASSYQWMTIALFKEHNVKYKAEVRAQDLVDFSQENVYSKRLQGNANMEPLRFDFAVFNEDGRVKCLIECQGEQHYDSANRIQAQNDAKKVDWAAREGFRLLSIQEKKYKGIVALKKLLVREGII